MGLGGSFLGKNKAAPTAQKPAAAGQQQPLKPGQQQPLKPGQQQPLKPGQAGPQVSETNKIETTYVDPMLAAVRTIGKAKGHIISE